MLKNRVIQSSIKRLEKLNEEIHRSARSHYLKSDPTRLKIFYLFEEHKELCPSDISKILNISMSAISHQLRLLEQSGVVTKVKRGKEIDYSLKEEKQNKRFGIF